jgi:hypothetical protein
VGIERSETVSADHQIAPKEPQEPDSTIVRCEVERPLYFAVAVAVVAVVLVVIPKGSASVLPLLVLAVACFLPLCRLAAA